LAVVQFKKPFSLSQDTQLKIIMLQNHGGGANGSSGRRHIQLGRCRVSSTTAPAPKAASIDHAALLAMQTPVLKHTA